MDQNLGHAEGVGNEARVLATGAAEAVERVACHVVAALHRDLLDRIGHVLDRDLDEAVGHVLGRAAVADLAREPRERLAHRIVIERQVPPGAEDPREEIRHELADHHVGVGEGERSAAAIALGSGIGAGAVRADPETRAVEMQDRAAARRHGMDQHHRRTHANARDLRLEGALVLAVEMRDVGRSAAHVEADQAMEAGLAPGLGHADDPAGRSRKNGVLALKQIGGGEPARRHHEHQAGARTRPLRVGTTARIARRILGHLRHVLLQDRGQVGVDHGGVAAPDQLDQWRDLVARGHLRETDLACEHCDTPLMLGVPIRVHEYDGDSLDAGRKRRPEIGAQGGQIGFVFHQSVGAYALVHLHDALVEHFRLDDVAGEYPGPGLVADPERIAEAPGDEQQRALALALEQAHWSRPWCPSSRRR